MKNKIKLDKIDEKLLAELSINSCLPIQHYSKRARISRSVAAYRIHRLEKAHVIHKYQTLIDFSKIGKAYARIGIRLLNFKPEDLGIFIKSLRENKQIAWLGSTQGRYNIAITFLYHDLTELLKLSSDIKNLVGSNIERLDISILRMLYVCNNNLLHGDMIPHVLIDYSSGISYVDETDTKIIAAIVENSRKNVIDISKETGLSAKTVLTHKKSLEKRKIIMRYSIAINPQTFNKESYHVFWTFSKQDSKEISRFKNYLLSLREITFITEAIGMSDLECDILAENIRELYEKLNNIKSEFSSLIKDFDIMLLTEVHEFF